MIKVVRMPAKPSVHCEVAGSDNCTFPARFQVTGSPTSDFDPVNRERFICVRHTGDEVQRRIGHWLSAVMRGEKS
jgi:hypothetical protein